MFKTLNEADEFISEAAIIAIDDSFFVFGGWSIDETDRQTIGRLSLTTHEWSRAGDMVQGRSGHSVIHDGTRVIIVGGSGSKRVETCSLKSNGQMACEAAAQMLEYYAYYPELFLVNDEFCKD